MPESAALRNSSLSLGVCMRDFTEELREGRRGRLAYVWRQARILMNNLDEGGVVACNSYCVLLKCVVCPHGYTHRCTWMHRHTQRYSLTLVSCALCLCAYTVTILWCRWRLQEARSEPKLRKRSGDVHAVEVFRLSGSEDEARAVAASQGGISDTF